MSDRCSRFDCRRNTTVVDDRIFFDELPSVFGAHLGFFCRILSLRNGKAAPSRMSVGQGGFDRFVGFARQIFFPSFLFFLRSLQVENLALDAGRPRRANKACPTYNSTVAYHRVWDQVRRLVEERTLARLPGFRPDSDTGSASLQRRNKRVDPPLLAR